MFRVECNNKYKRRLSVRTKMYKKDYFQECRANRLQFLQERKMKEKDELNNETNANVS